MHDFDESLPFGDNQFDVVYARHVLEHVKHYRKLVPEMARVCKREMIIILFRPLEEKDKIDFRKHKGTYYNSYGREDFLATCSQLFEVTEVIENHGNVVGPSWNEINWIIHSVKG